MRFFRNMLIGLLLAPWVSMLFITASYAHRMIVSAWVDGEMVHTESRFSDGKGVRRGKIIVFDDRTSQKLLEGQTDEKGEFVFKSPVKDRLRIEVKTKTGHKNRWIVYAEDFEPNGSVTPQNPTSIKTEQKNGGKREMLSQSGTFNIQDIEAAMERVMDQKLKPILKMVSRFQPQGPSFKDIISGLGYIFGLVGVGAYFSSRRKSDKNN